MTTLVAGRPERSIPVTVITGFLGAGKTTLLRRVLRENAAEPRPRRLAVVVNDMSDLEVDGELVRGGHAVDEERGTLVSLYSGSLGVRRVLDDLSTSLDRLIQASAPDHILIETSGSTHPWPLLEMLATRPSVVVRRVVALVDAVSLLRDHDGGASLLEPHRSESPAGRTADTLLTEQIEFADFLLLTKIDRLDRAVLTTLGRTLHILNPRADVVGVTWGVIDRARLLDGGDYDMARARLRAAALPVRGDGVADPATYDIGSTIVRDARPFHPRRLWDLVHEGLGRGIHRSKGFLWLASRPRDVLLWNQTGGQIGLDFIGSWRASVLEDPDARLLPEERTHLRDLLARAHPLFGDRACEIAVIGAEHDREIFVPRLNACLCADHEILAWQRGEAFDDPWPSTMRRLT